jgi:hypothetical protein
LQAHKGVHSIPPGTPGTGDNSQRTTPAPRGRRHAPESTKYPTRSGLSNRPGAGPPDYAQCRLCHERTGNLAGRISSSGNKAIRPNRSLSDPTRRGTAGEATSPRRRGSFSTPPIRVQSFRTKRRSRRAPPTAGLPGGVPPPPRPERPTGPVPGQRPGRRPVTSSASGGSRVAAPGRTSCVRRVPLRRVLPGAAAPPL